MKIAFTGIELPAGKAKYNDEKVAALVEKHKAKKITPYTVEFMRDAFEEADTIIIPKDKILDLIVVDMEKIEQLLAHTENEKDKPLLLRCQKGLESEIPLCDLGLNDEEAFFIKSLSPLTLKPVVQVEGEIDEDEAIAKALEKSNTIFFYTAGDKEVRAWPVKKGSDMITCAGKIHTDLARGFIKGDVINFDEYMKYHNFNDAKAKGAVKVVERDHVITDGDIIEIRFNV